ncbi:MAG: CinA family protein [Nocardioides sp.]
MDATSPGDLARELHAVLGSRGLSLATAESLTGGALAELVSGVPGASATYVGGVVSYATSVKHQLLGVSSETVASYGVVSAECAGEMARGVRALLGSDLGVSATGVAGPEDQEGKPVGLVYVAVDGPAGTRTHELRLAGDRGEIRAAASARAVSAVLEALLGADR